MNNKILLFLPGLKNTKIKIFSENFGGEKILEIEKGENENEKILDFFEKNSVNLENISKIFFCNGPGRFMSMRICAVIANLFKNQNPKIELFQIPTAEFLKMKSNGEKIFLQLNNSEIFTLINGEEKIYSREDLEKKFEGELEIFYYGNLKKWLFDFENFEEISEKNLFSDKKILEKKYSIKEKILGQNQKNLRNYYSILLLKKRLKNLF